MSTQGRRKNTSVSQDLAENPYNYDFFQAVRLLERSAIFNKNKPETIAKNPVAKFLPPNTESIRFHTHQTFSFPAAEIKSIKKVIKKSGLEQWDMAINFIGLTSVMGVMPYHYTEMILQRMKMKDHSLEHFFDLFNHRTISLFYQAATKYKLPIEYERKKLTVQDKDKEKNDQHTQVLLSLIGLGTKNLSNRLYTKDESLIYYSGLFTQKVRTSTGLKQIIQNHFNIPVKIKEFVGQWQELIDDVRTCLPSKEKPKGLNNCLGKTVMLGYHGWFSQSKISIILGPLNGDQLQLFSPGTSALKALNEIVRLYVGIEYDYDFKIRINKSDIPDKTALSKTHPAIMGWNTWLSGKPARHLSGSETLDISVTASRIK